MDEVFPKTAFIQEFASRLVIAEEFDNLAECDFEATGKRNKRLSFSGYDFVDDEEQVVIAIADYRHEGVLEKLTTTDAAKELKAAEAFIEASLDGSLKGMLEESSESCDVARDLEARREGGRLQKIRVYLLSNAQASDSIKPFPTKLIEGIPVEFHIWDLERLDRVESSQLGREEIDIDLTQWVPGGLRALDASTPGATVQTLLLAIPAAALASIYELHGGRVLEANVRSFLSGRGKVNKGIRGTIQQSPELFLAYNNGITATASGITATTSEGVALITAIRDLQIVNGGQTTASLYYVHRNDKASLSNIHVQVKLIVVGTDTAQELVPNISRFANTQNKVSESDFFSNHPFHLRMEEKSQQIMTPAPDGQRFGTHWFYERTRGQYVNEKSKRSVREARLFETRYPKGQVITKPDAAKYLVSWDQKPHTVSSGAQKNFQSFAQGISAEWERSDLNFDDLYFRSLVAKGILFNALRSRVAKADWYKLNPGYLANIVTYSIARFANEIELSHPKSTLDFEAIWNMQSVPEAILEDLEYLAEEIRELLTAESRLVLNVTEWAKREKCWDLVKNLPFQLDEGTEEWLTAAETLAEVKKKTRKQQIVDTSISDQIAVVNLGKDYWDKLRKFGSKNKYLSDKDLSLLKYATGEAKSIASDKQSALLIALKERMEASGFAGR